jgi:hypothetical protein
MLITVTVDRKTKKVKRDKKYPKHIKFPKEFISELSLMIEAAINEKN